MTDQNASQPPAGLQGRIIPVTPLQQNCTLLWCSETMKGAFVDPGGDLDQLLAAAHEMGVEIEKLLVTHGHFDHCGQTGILAKQLGVPIEGPHIGDKPIIDNNAQDSQRYGLGGCEAFTPNRWLVHGDQVTVGKLVLDVIHCPGHTPGHIVFHHAPSHLAMVGDVLFQGSIGRTDFPGGNHQQLIDSITQRLWPLGNETQFVPGHGPMSTFGQERKMNAFVSDFALG